MGSSPFLDQMNANKLQLQLQHVTAYDRVDKIVDA